MKRKKLFIILTILSIVILGIGGTFAYLSTSATATNITQIKSGNLTMTIDGGGSENVSLMPSKCTSEHAIKKKITASAVNTSGGKVSFSIGMNIATLDNDLKRDTMKYILSTSADSCSVGIVAGGTFKDKTVGEDVWLIKNDYNNITNSGNTYTKTYYLYIWLDESETQNVSGSLSVNMKGTSSNNPNLPVASDYNDGNGTNTLFYKIKSSADTTTRINFSKTTKQDKTNGIYTTTNTDNGVPVYYYRGNVNNYVLFANFCWRIVRTTETGGVKLIYNGVPSNGECNNTGEETTIGKFAFNTNYNSPAYVGYMYDTAYTAANKDITKLSGSIIFGNDITYANGMYTLTDTYTLADTSKWSSEYSTIAEKYHYTCFTSNDTCEKVDYIYLIDYDGDRNAYYFKLSNGKNHLDILKEMLDDPASINDSTIKTAIDTWYQNNMTNYTSQLEDTIFCSDRSYDVSINTSGWNKDYNNYMNALQFGGMKRLSEYKPSLICPNNNDKFTVSSSNGNGALTYPVALITADEVAYAGNKIYNTNESYYLHNGVNNWYISPNDFFGWSDYRSTSAGSSTGGSGYFKTGVIDGVNNLQPVISLKKGTALSGGSGTATDPYIVS